MSALTTISTTQADGVLTITLNRPDVLNACTTTMGVELGAVLRAAQRDDAVRCVLLTGAGRAFCAGQDLKEFEALRRGADGAPVDLDLGTHLRQNYNPVVLRLRSLEKPVVAAVNGAAAGAGASFALAADLRICAREAYFMMAFVHLGLVPDVAATLTLVQHVGYARAAAMCFLGERLSAEDALRAGLVYQVVPEAELAGAAMELARRLAALPTRAIGLTKRALTRSWTATLDEQIEYEAFLQDAAGRTDDFREGLTAFLAKRSPRFTGR